MFIRKCFPSGFSQATDLLSLRKSVNVSDNNRLLMILQKSEALKNYMNFTIGPDKRLLYELTQQAMNELDQKIDLLSHEVTTTEDLEVFHSKIFPYMKHWAFKNQSDFYADMWIDAVEKGLHQFSTWNQIKGLLDIADPTEYFYSIEECGDVTMPFECTFDFISNKYTYIDPSHTVQVQINPISKLMTLIITQM
jgi:hypothetical protein